MENLASGKSALQSSFSGFSLPDEALRAISGEPDGRFSFHTDHEPRPWWMTDLGEIAAIHEIVVYNRCDAARERARFLSVQIFDPAIGGWQTLYKAENEFGGADDDRPLRLQFGAQPKLARFVKFELTEPGTLHLDHIAILGTRPRLAYQEKRIENERCAAYVDGLRDEPSGPRGLGAIVALVRGYNDVTKYATLKRRNQAIWDCINRHASPQYPLIIWHEGNIAADHQRYILDGDSNADVRFVDVSRRFRLPPHVTPADLEEHWPLGYRLMCKLHTWDIWQLAGEFDYVLRVDEDCILRDIETDRSNGWRTKVWIAHFPCW